MNEAFKAEDIKIGYHPSGYRIDKTAPPMKMYTQWTVTDGGCWMNPKAVCFHSLPPNGWVNVERFDWERDGLI